MGAMSELETCFEPVSQTDFVTVDDFITLFTRSYVFYSHGCNKFVHTRTFFTLADMITLIFTLLTEVWPCDNRTTVTNNYTMLTEVRANQNCIKRLIPMQF